MKKIIFFVILAFLSNQLVFAQKWITYPKEGGFPSVMTSFVHDDNGTLWFGSFNDGIYKFDGLNWKKTIDSTPKAINDMVIVNGDVWAAANGGLIHIPNLDDSQIQVLKYSDSVSNQFWTVAYDSSGTIWVGSGDANKTLLLRYKNGIWNEIDCQGLGKQSNISSIVVDSHNRKWFISDAGLSMYNDTTLTTYNHTNSTLPQTSFTQLEIDADGNFWIGTLGYGIYKFDGIYFTNYNSQNTILPLQDFYTGIVFDKFKNIWISTQVNGVYRFNGNEWNNFNAANSGISTNMIRAIAIDKNNRKIFGTIDKGVIIFDDNMTSVSNELKKDEIYPNPVTSQIFIKTVNKKISTVRIFNQLGEDVTSECSRIEMDNSNGFVTINVSKLTPAVYFLHKDNLVQKFIKIQ